MKISYPRLFIITFKMRIILNNGNIYGRI